MKNSITSLFATALTVTALSLTALAQPTERGQTAPATPVDAVVRTLGTQPAAPSQPLVVQEQVERKGARPSREPSERPHGKSRADRPAKSSGPEKPLLEVKGF